jgi:inositol phosphorylceramide mannosyltransferase catalytic subunit
MRRGLLGFLLIIFLLLGLAIRSVFTLITLLFEDASADAIRRSELPAPNSTLTNPSPHLIPKIIHQTYINSSIPSRWQAAQQSCIDLHPDYDYILWTDAKSHDFIRREYPWFLETFENYPYNIQRADAIRYFVLVYYGGVYIDLDDGCKRRFDPLLSYSAWLRRTIPTGISNDAMGASPQHPFFLSVIEHLQDYNRSWLLPYITIMGSTGPLFLSVMWKKYMNHHRNEAPDWAGRVRVLMPDEYSKHSWSFFNIFKGDSWHQGDAKLIFWMGQHWMFLTAAGFGLVGIIGLFGWWSYDRILLIAGRRKYGPSGHSSPQLAPKKKVRVSLWKRWAAKQEYELVEQHDA